MKDRNLIFLVPRFLLSGLDLVMVLMTLNLTVTEGTMNGLIFYVNVAYAYPKVFCIDIFFTWTFISWLNLDLGFEICVYSGMDDYQHVWLLCGYLIYLLSIQVFIIFLSRRFE